MYNEASSLYIMNELAWTMKFQRSKCKFRVNSHHTSWTISYISPIECFCVFFNWYSSNITFVDGIKSYIFNENLNTKRKWGKKPLTGYLKKRASGCHLCERRNGETAIRRELYSSLDDERYVHTVVAKIDHCLMRLRAIETRRVCDTKCIAERAVRLLLLTTGTTRQPAPSRLAVRMRV